MEGHRSSRTTAPLVALGVGLACLVAGLAPGSAVPARAADPPATPPPVRHVFVVNLENFSLRESFGSSSPEAAYLASVLPSRGVKIDSFYGTGHNSLDNYIAQISGQAPNPNTQADCPQYIDFSPTPVVIDPNGQAVGQGCVFPTEVRSLPDQMEARGLSWKGYMQDLGKDPVSDGGFRCGHPLIGNGDSASNRQRDKYATKHNPFVYFHSLTDDDASCRAHVGPLDDLFTDMQSVATTPNLAYITPNQCDDGHEDTCEQYSLEGQNGTAGGDVFAAGRFMAWLAPKILASPAYRQDGLLVVTSDEAHIFLVATADAEPDDTAACCNEIPGPNSSSPGISGPGGGKIGAVLASPYINPGTASAQSYNHYSTLRSLEDLFGIKTGGADGQGHLGFAAATAAGSPGSFGADVFNLPVGAPRGPAPRDPTPGRQPVGPRPADAGIRWDAPSPQGNDLNGVDCASDEACVAVGDTGTILVRTAGAWRRVATGVDDDLFDVSCGSAQECVAVGDGGLVLTSADGGTSWAHSRIAAVALRGVSCPSADRCFAVGDDGAVDRSNDRGASWSDVPSGITEPLARIDCATDQSCVATGGERTPYDLTTHDGGATWSASATHSGDNGTGVSCTSAAACTIVSSDAYARWTTDGGGRWNGQRQPAELNNLSAVACTDATTCYIAGTRASVFKLVKSGTSGTFTRQTPSPSANFGDDLRDIACPGTTRCYAVGDEGQILATADGSTWSSERSGLVPRTPGDPAPTSVAALRSVDCMDSGACVAVGDDGSIATKAGPADSWRGTDSGVRQPPATPPLFGVGCTGAAACVAVGGYGTILRRAGATADWQKQASTTSNELYGVDCWSDADCVAVGAYGTALTSHDGGAGWSPAAPATPYPLNGVSCTADGRCAAVGSLGTIVRSGDGGASWQPADSGTLAYLSGVSCVTSATGTAATCVAVGQSGTALVSSDGGATWVASPTGIDDQLDSVDCPTATSCTASGSSGTVVHTGDAGASWTAIGTGTARGLNGVACAGTVACYAVGEGATVLAIGDTPLSEAPTLTIADAAVAEGDSGTSYAPLAVTLSAPVPTGGEVDVSYATQALDGAAAATPGADFEPVSGRLRFLPGDSQKLVLVPIIGDTADESDEQAAVELSAPAGALVGDGRAIVTIHDDDTAASQPPPASDGEPPSATAPADQPTAPVEQQTAPADQQTASGGEGGTLAAHAGSGTAEPPCKVPRLRGRRLVQALRLLARAHCTVGALRERRSRKPPRTVVAQRPAPGRTLAHGGRVTIVVSRGGRRPAT
ncbi:MAG: alkaline phosphatase family protein [Thermoleophilaceae bacterium]